MKLHISTSTELKSIELIDSQLCLHFLLSDWLTCPILFLVLFPVLSWVICWPFAVVLLSCPSRPALVSFSLSFLRLCKCVPMQEGKMKQSSSDVFVLQVLFGSIGSLSRFPNLDARFKVNESERDNLNWIYCRGFFFLSLYFQKNLS